MLTTLTLLATLAAAPTTAGGAALPFPTGNVQTLNLVQWDANALPKVYERSDQLPLTDEEVAKLSRAGFAPDKIVKMIEERHCSCDASADGLIKLKQAGTHPDVLSAVSLHSLKPNRGLQLSVTLDFVGESRTARQGFIYLFIEDGQYTRIFTANIGELLARDNGHESTVDRSDIIRARSVRRIEFAGEVPLKTYGTHSVLVASSASPTLNHPSQLTPLELSKAQSYTFEYPRSSLMNGCFLQAGYQRDAILKDKWRFLGSRFACEWN